MGKIIMPKNSALLEEVEAVLKIYYEAKDWISNDEYKGKLKSIIGDDQYASSYTKKCQITSYFGFTEWEDITNVRSPRRITARGKAFYSDIINKNQEGIIEDLICSLEQVTFGRDNYGCPDSDSDIEPPVVFIRASLDLGYLTYKEFAYLLWKLEDCGGNYTDAKKEINNFRGKGQLDLPAEAQKYTDAKPIMVLIRWGLLEEDDSVGGNKKIVIPKAIKDKYSQRIRNLKIYNIDKNVGNADVPTVKNNKYSATWFSQMAQQFTSADIESEQLYKDFRTKYGPEALKAVEGTDLLHKIFINETRDKENLCYVLEFDKQYTQFGGIGGGSAYKYGLYYSADKESWMSGSARNPKTLTLEDAIVLGTKIRNEILEGVKVIESAGDLSELKDYAELNTKLYEVMPTTINKKWVIKYFHMLFPQLFPPFYNDEWQNKVLAAIDEEPDGNSFVRMGQIALFVKKCGISTLAFSKVIYNLDSLGEIEDNEEPVVENALCTFESEIKNGKNVVVYGTPGCGKSYYVQNTLLKEFGVSNDEQHRIRTTFYQDYTNTDFVGQIIPKVKEDKSVTYEFNPGPFALAMKMAIERPNEPVALVIEELNRGNAASIFGDIFQLLDRTEEGKSQYKITNVNLQDYLNKVFKDKNIHFDYIVIPSNLYIVATMNTSDQNVFTLDTAFKRRWKFEKLPNVFAKDHEYAEYYVPGMTGVTWRHLVDSINRYIVKNADELSSEDKQLGVYFIGKETLCKEQTGETDVVKKKEFAYKLLEYLWDDVAKYNHVDWFGPDIKTLDQLIVEYMEKGQKVFIDGILG